MGKLTAIGVKGEKRCKLHADGNGLYLKVQATKTPDQPNKSWIFRWGAGGKNTLGLGSLKDVTLAEARNLAADKHKLVSQGIDPREERKRLALETKQKQQAITFQEAAEMLIESKLAGWKNPKHAQQWPNSLAAYAYPVIGSIPCAEVTTAQVLSILKPIWTSKHETAVRVRGRIESVMDWSIAMGHRDGDNPAAWKSKLAPLLPSISKRRRIIHHKAMPYVDVPNMFKIVQSDSTTSAKALLFCILTATRTTETIEAKWDEFDFKQRLWTIPKHRMKKEKEHRVPLSDEAVQLLDSIDRKEGSPWVFNGRTRSGSTIHSKPLSNMAMLNYLQIKLEHKDLTVHGFRSSFRDWAGETTGHSREVIEQALAHSLVDQAEAAYQRGDYIEKRRLLMNDWAAYCNHCST